jgi:hypothetical protein
MKIRRPKRVKDPLVPKESGYTWDDIRSWSMLNPDPYINQLAFRAEKGDVWAWRKLEERYMLERTVGIIQ